MTSTAEVSPGAVFLTTAPNSVYHDKVTVSFDPHGGAIPLMDVYFLSDTTGSMQPIIDEVKEHAQKICDSLHERAQNIAADLRFGVGNYRDFDYPPEERFQRQLAPASGDVGAAVAAIGTWQTAGGDDIAEGQLYALDQLAEEPGGKLIGWRPGTKRIVVWFGDAPGHDPLCSKVFTDLSDDITEESVIAKLREQEIIVITISVTTSARSPGLNADPIPYSHDGKYVYKDCGYGGKSGQGERIANQTGGVYADGIQEDSIVDTIIRLGGTEVEKIGKVSWAPDETLAPFLKPPLVKGDVPVEAGQGSVSFDVNFNSINVSSGAGVGSGVVTESVTGNVNIKADGVLVGQQNVTISNPDLTVHEYRIQSMAKDKLFLQISDGDGWTVDLGTQKEGQDAALQQWKLLPARSPSGESCYLISNLYPRPADDTAGRLLEVYGGNAVDHAGILTRIFSIKDALPNHKWRLIPMGTDDEGVIYRIQSCAPKIDKYNYHSLDAWNATENEKVILMHYYGNFPYQENHSQHWRLVVL